MSRKPTDKRAEAETEMVAATVALQEQGLDLLRAGMEALKGVMEGAARATEPPSEAEVEAGFDNMPV